MAQGAIIGYGIGGIGGRGMTTIGPHLGQQGVQQGAVQYG
jgi:hypothetical protein